MAYEPQSGGWVWVVVAVLALAVYGLAQIPADSFPNLRWLGGGECQTYGARAEIC